MDIASVAGMIIGIGSIFGGFLIEGGHLGAIVQPTAFLIVLGGTIGAICLQFPGYHLKIALGGLKTIIMPHHYDLRQLVRDIVNYAQKARREGVVSLETEATAAKDPFLKKALSLAVDGTESRIIRDALEIELQIHGEHGEIGAKVWEAGGGYTPTVGIIGAVLGLIHVMENLSDPAKLGGGIAVAFVATVYGVFFANLVFLPFASKLKIRHAEETVRYELILSGITAIVEGENPRIIEQKLYGYCGGAGHGDAKAADTKAA
jgi:chemotaxis protein MotA